MIFSGSRPNLLEAHSETGCDMTTFEEEITAAQVPLLTYIGVLCGSSAEAEDILAETNLTLVRRQAAYDPSRPFLPWARTVAFYAVRTWRTNRQRSRLVFDTETVERLREVLEAPGPDAEEEARGEHRLALLLEAEKELTSEMRYVLTRHYVYGDSLVEIGRQLNRTAHSVATSLHYIRKVLKKSVEKKLKEAGNENG